ncbi:MAG: hypothetical protein QOG62_2760 [Thermoleophilaceae bacterium]|nr:hypothetical protein [Thermoleophilaceae bacterium]MEA2623016.1 hypothetical protein [Chloroflexota bacterium]
MTTGDVTASLLLTYDREASEFPTADGEGFDQLWTDANGNVLRMTLDMAGGELSSAFVAVGAPGTNVDDETYFADFVRSQCDVQLTRFDATEVAGTFDCVELGNFNDDMSIDAQGTFSAIP